MRASDRRTQQGDRGTSWIPYNNNNNNNNRVAVGHGAVLRFLCVMTIRPRRPPAVGESARARTMPAHNKRLGRRPCPMPVLSQCFPREYNIIINADRSAPRKS